LEPELNKRQRQIAQAFLNRHLPGQVLGETPRPIPRKTYLGVNCWDATSYASTMTYSLFSEKPRISAREFEREMLSRIPLLDRLTKSFKRALPVRKEFEYSGSSFATSFFTVIRASNLPFKDQVRAFRLTVRFLPGWLTRRPRRLGNYRVHFRIGGHPEAPLTIAVRTADGKRVATVGGYLYYEGRKRAVRVTNVQGVKAPVRKRGEPTREFRAKKRAHLALYPALKAQVGGNWRAFFIRQVLSAAGEKRAPVVGELPRRFYSQLAGEGPVPDVDDKEYRRQVQQLRHAYRRAGLVEQPDGTWRSPPRKRKPRRRPRK
jgi:hypothetical protein